jgi:hypothetical protein
VDLSMPPFGAMYYSSARQWKGEGWKERKAERERERERERGRQRNTG